MYPYNNRWLNSNTQGHNSERKSDRIQLFFQLENLPRSVKCSQVSLSHDPTSYTGNQLILGATEKSMESGSALFSKAIEVDYIFQKKQSMIVNLLLNNGNFRDSAIFSLGALVGSQSNSLTLKFDNCDVSVTVMFEGSAKSVNPRNDRALFSSYLQGSLNISVIVSIDFTSSNKMPHFPDSLHRMSPNSLNDYQSVIKSVCGILLDYDADKLIQVYGFGGAAAYPGFGKTSHFFPVSGDWANCAGHGVEGVFDIYSKGLKNVKLSGPTFFSPMLKEINKFTEVSYQQDKNSYTVLLVITDGCIHDMNQTIEEIVTGSTLPLSIIIVGVGCADFTNMEILDSDDVVLRDKRGRRAARDIVQFVSFDEFRNEGVEILAEEVLEEVPRQVVQFMKASGKQPGTVRAKRREKRKSQHVYGKMQAVAGMGNMRTTTPNREAKRTRNTPRDGRSRSKKKYRNKQAVSKSNQKARSRSPYMLNNRRNQNHDSMWRRVNTIEDRHERRGGGGGGAHFGNGGHSQSGFGGFGGQGGGWGRSDGRRNDGWGRDNGWGFNQGGRGGGGGYW